METSPPGGRFVSSEGSRFTSQRQGNASSVPPAAGPSPSSPQVEIRAVSPQVPEEEDNEARIRTQKRGFHWNKDAPDLDTLADNSTDTWTAEEDTEKVGRMWSRYLSQTDKIDRMLVENWKGDADGILIFTGLFAAIVTAFIVESYKFLSPDPADITVALLTQLVTLVNGTQPLHSPPASSSSFSASRSSVRVNVLWIASLVLSLACALGATLVQQWVRAYTQATQDDQTHPAARGRGRAFAYAGVTRFRMPEVTTGLPLLLHAAVFLFLAGLIEFLRPLSALVADITLALACVVGAVYAMFTVLPLIACDSPFQTPLSFVVWRALYPFMRAALLVYAPVSQWSWKVSRRWTLPGANPLFDLVDRFAHGMRAYWSTWMVNRPVDRVDMGAVLGYCVTDETLESPRALREIAAFLCPTLLSWSGGSQGHTTWAYEMYNERMLEASLVGAFIQRSLIVLWTWHTLARTAKHELKAAGVDPDDSEVEYERDSDEEDDALVWCLEALWIFSQSGTTHDISYLEYRRWFPRRWWRPVICAMRPLVEHPSRVVACTARCVLAYALFHLPRESSTKALGLNPLWENPALTDLNMHTRSATCNRPLVILIELLTDMMPYLEEDSRLEQILTLPVATAVQRIESLSLAESNDVHPALRAAFADLWARLERLACPQTRWEKDRLRGPPCITASPFSNVGGEIPLLASSATFGRSVERLQPVRDWLGMAEAGDADHLEEPPSRSPAGRVRFEDSPVVEVYSTGHNTGTDTADGSDPDANLRDISDGAVGWAGRGHFTGSGRSVE